MDNKQTRQKWHGIVTGLTPVLCKNSTRLIEPSKWSPELLQVTNMQPKSELKAEKTAFTGLET